jgi:hypothetical protein
MLWMAACNIWLLITIITPNTLAQSSEEINRGVVALTVATNQIYVGWRLLLEDPPDVAFNVYRQDIGYGGFEKVNQDPITHSTNYLDGDGAYDFVVQHPDFNVDPYYRPGYWKRSPEPYKLDAYTSEGKFLNVADIIGDWREELVTSLPGELRIYSTNRISDRKEICRMQNHLYRMSVADASMGYYNSPQVGFK